MSEMEEVRVGVTWRHLVACALATGISTILAIFAVIAAPVAPFPGVSGLYLAAAIYVPLSLWLGIWGVIAAYISCVILGFVTGLGVWSFVWSLADLAEGIIPLIAFRLTKTDVDIGKDLKRPNVLYILLGILIVNLIVAAIATALVIPAIWITTLIIAIVLIVGMYLVNPSRPWLLFVIFGIVLPSLVSALIGIGVLVIAGFAPPESFWIGVIGWFAGDLIVLSAIATPMMITLTGKLKQTSIFVEKWVS
ncbi:MAG: hypothetical protein GF383_16400 [Candidatus Lokiarchaeota archaeon]|nr:hypothetical protein [Candidatus Lokiarchaeota archaeon]MBD3343342.1 hypothetical protein [Candidatus Lokiarchaeota archaeon]